MGCKRYRHMSRAKVGTMDLRLKQRLSSIGSRLSANFASKEWVLACSANGCLHWDLRRSCRVVAAEDESLQGVNCLSKSFAGSVLERALASHTEHQ